MWGKDQEKALRALFSAFDKENIKWMVFRNFEGLPQKNDSKDVDLLVERRQIPLAKKTLIETMKREGYSRFTFDRFQCIWCYSFFKTEIGAHNSIKIDLFYGQVWRGTETVEFDKIYSTGCFYNGFKVPNPIMNSFLLWIKPLMTGGKIKEKYIKSILVNADKEEFDNLIIETFNRNVLEQVKPYLSEEKIRETGKFCNLLRKVSWKKGFKKHPLGTIADTLSHYSLEIIRRTGRPKVSCIAVLGPDGVGKTTVINEVKKQLEDTFIKDSDKIEVVHFRPNVLPNLKKLLKKNYDESKEEFTNPHRAKSAGFVSSIIRLVYYWIDYIIGWPQVKRKCVNGTIVVFDRYSYDFVVDPQRTRISLPDYIIRAFMMNTHTPDKTFFLVADPEIIYDRKQELELDEIYRQVKKYKEVAKTRESFCLVDASKTPQEIGQKMIYSLVQSLPEL